jgi:mRNA interferase MazF
MVTEGTVSRGEFFLVALNPTRVLEIRKTRPCVFVFPDELNAHLRTFTVAPLTTDGHPFPFRVRDRFDGTDGHVVADQPRTVDRDGLVKRLGNQSTDKPIETLSVLQTIFSV